MTSKDGLVKDIKSNKLKKLILNDNNGDLPQYPSAQLWNRMSEIERTEMRTLLGGSWPDYEEKMKAHWPKPKSGLTRYVNG